MVLTNEEIINGIPECKAGNHGWGRRNTKRKNGRRRFSETKPNRTMDRTNLVSRILNRAVGLAKDRYPKGSKLCGHRGTVGTKNRTTISSYSQRKKKQCAFVNLS